MIQTQVSIRPACEADAEAVRCFLAGLSMDAQYLRFFTGLGAVSPSLVRELVTVNARQLVAVAMLGPAVIGHAMATISNGVIELGVVVAECHRKQGLATRMVRDLIGEASRQGAEALRFDLLCENQLVLGWIRRSLPDTRFERDGHTLTGHAVLDVAALTSSAA